MWSRPFTFQLFALWEYDLERIWLAMSPQGKEPVTTAIP